MELSSHLLTAAAFGTMKESECTLAEQLIEQTGDNTQTFICKHKVCHLLISMTDAMRYPGAEMAELYSHRWEIELVYRESMQTMQLSRLTLRSKMVKLPERRERAFPR